MKVLDYDGLKQVVAKIKSLIDLKASKSDLNKLLQDLKIQDTRDKNENPTYYIKNKSRKIVKEFKILKVIGINSSSDYCALITMFPWQDNTAGCPVQMAFILRSDEIYTRRGTSDTAWGRWRRVLDDRDVKTKLSEFTEDSTHRTVTDAEKKKWNDKAEKSYVDSAKSSLSSDITNKYNALNNDKANKVDLNSYVKKDGNKVLSDNNFTNAYKTKIDRDLKTDSQIMKLALKVARRDSMFQSNELYKDLNNYYGTSISSSIKTLSQFQQSQTAMASFLNNSLVKKEMDSDPFFSKSIFEATMPYFKNNASQFKQHVLDDFKARVIYGSPKCLKQIVSSYDLIRVATDNEETTYLFSRYCPYLYVISKENEIFFCRNVYEKQISNIEDIGEFIILGLYRSHLMSIRQYLPGVSKSDGTSIYIDDMMNATYIGSENNVLYKEQQKNKQLFKCAYRYESNGKLATWDVFNMTRHFGVVKSRFKNEKISNNNIFSLVILNLKEIEQDIARGL